MIRCAGLADDPVNLPLDVFDRLSSLAGVYRLSVLKLKDDKLSQAREAGEREQQRRRCDAVGLPPLFI